VAYLSKQLDAVSPSWLPCLCALAAIAIMAAKADKLTLRQKHSVSSPLCFNSHKISQKLLVNKFPNGQISKHFM
jgi:hypothetical protein